MTLILGIIGLALSVGALVLLAIQRKEQIEYMKDRQRRLDEMGRTLNRLKDEIGIE